MVVICLPTASLTTTPQERIATPSMWTVQAPHCAMPQPYFVPVRPIFSRIAQSSGVSGSTSTSIDFPLIEVCHRDPLVSSIHRLNFGGEFVPEPGTVQINIPRLRCIKFAWEACCFALLPQIDLLPSRRRRIAIRTVFL